ncbi:MAG: response regulator [Deltaproteobacteria bacterium]|nr:response regulator [Deltaproteobacteria bacterium]MCW5801653.1 response regulator [Deltaproteobacteria bacterium]
MPSSNTCRRVLIVDDHPDTAEVLAVMFQVLGHESQIALSGAAALLAVREFDPEVIVLDLELPDISGYEVARALRDTTYAHGTFIAAVSGWGRAEDVARARRSGFDAHFRKPIGLSRVRDILLAIEPPRTFTCDEPATGELVSIPDAWAPITPSRSRP